VDLFKRKIVLLFQSHALAAELGCEEDTVDTEEILRCLRTKKAEDIVALAGVLFQHFTFVLNPFKVKYQNTLLITRMFRNNAIYPFRWPLTVISLQIQSSLSH
jgi:isopentenyldiphosphate isomerase